MTTCCLVETIGACDPFSFENGHRIASLMTEDFRFSSPHKVPPPNLKIMLNRRPTFLKTETLVSPRRVRSPMLSNSLFRLPLKCWVVVVHREQPSCVFFESVLQKYRRISRNSVPQGDPGQNQAPRTRVSAPRPRTPTTRTPKPDTIPRLTSGARSRCTAVV